jgi:hypothetical protein
MSRRPKSPAGLYMDGLFLLAMTAKNSLNDIRLFRRSLGHTGPPIDMLEVGRFRVNRIAVNLTVENPAKNKKAEPEDSARHS